MRDWLHRTLSRLGLVCPKSGRLKPPSRLRGLAVCFLPVVGFLSLIWFLVRVIEKPSRAAYPCMRAAAPLASGFVVWVAALFAAPVIPAALLRRKDGSRRKGLVVLLAAAMVLAGGLAVVCQTGDLGGVRFPNAVTEPANQPMGTARGIFPGRVVWVWNPAATNKRLTNRPGDGYFLPKNTDQAAVDTMLSEGLRLLTGKDSDAEAWDAVFKFHNRELASGKAAGGYKPGQKIFIKTNATSAWGGNFESDLSVKHNMFYGIAETSPAVVLAVLRQLVNVVKVSQADIWVGDPMKHVYRHAYELWHAEFPNVHYIDRFYGADKEREKDAFTAQPVIFYSDRGTVMKAGIMNKSETGPATDSDTLCTLFETADYVINIPALKGHKRAGVSMFAKNHFGSNGRVAANHLHGGLVNPDENDARRQGYGLYRVQVDLFGHKWLGGKNLLYLMDALFAGPEAVYPPTKWKMVPFKNDWTSSLFLSLDPVAIESVGYDFLRSEYISDTPYSWVQMQGVDDYLHQAADHENWPKDIVYDPENDGTPIGSLGVHEHWNNPVDKQYSRNLETGDGIELVKAGAGFTVP
ncbi:MAG: DUF362 domain-containing protein [Spirochaetales bacterium]|nr:DUF362 domain-containing protein [Spirochaetales bacterium]